MEKSNNIAKLDLNIWNIFKISLNLFRRRIKFESQNSNYKKSLLILCKIFESGQDYKKGLNKQP